MDCVCVFGCDCICKSVIECARACVRICTSVRVYACLCMYVRACVYVFMSMYVSTCVWRARLSVHTFILIFSSIHMLMALNITYEYECIRANAFMHKYINLLRTRVCVCRYV